jgi:serine/threonine protein kinase
MAKLTPAKKVKIFEQLNERKLPWQNSRFVISEDEYEWLGNGNFSEVYVMEDVGDSSNKYAVKIIGFNENRRIHKSDIASYKKEPIIQYGLAESCTSVVKIIDTEVLSIKLDDNGKIEDAIADDCGVDKTGWLVLVLIKMEKLTPIIEQNLTGDYIFKVPALKDAEDREILSLAIDIAEALETSHSKKIMHRDVKLENIFYDKASKTYKLGDFGIARITNQGSASTKGAGTLGYEAPEVEGGNNEKYSYQADIYSFGVTIYLLMNELRFPGSTGYHVNRSVQYNPNSVIEYPIHGSDELKKVICSLIRYNPEDRPEDMAAVLSELIGIYTEKYGARESHIISKKRWRDETEIVKNNISKTVTEVKNVPTEVKEHKEVLGNIVAEVKQEPNKMAQTSEEKSNGTGGVIPNNAIGTTKKHSEVYKGIIGSLFVIVGLFCFAMMFKDTLEITKTPMVMVSLSANLVVSFIAYILKCVKNKKMPYVVYFILFVFSVYVMISGGLSWFYLLISIGLFIGGVTEIFVLNIVAFLYILIMHFATFTMFDGIAVMKNAWIFFALTLYGFLLVEQYDKQDDIFSIILCEDIFAYCVGFILLVTGVIIFLINLIPSVTVSELLMNMHFIYVGLIIWVAQMLVGLIDRRLS